MSALERQVGGSHYTSKAIQPVEFWMKNDLGSCEGSVVKYVTRWREKGGVDDLRKARHFLDFILENNDYIARHFEKRQVYPVRFPNCISANAYIAANKLPEPEAYIVRMVWTWNVTGAVARILEAAEQLDEMIEAAWMLE